jgi:SAM-dependent methyltransferase
MADWISFFDTENPIYVNERHRAVHARLVAAGLLKHVPSRDCVMLDYGCGEALYAETLAEAVGRLILCEAAPHLREKLAARVRGNSKISVLSPEDVEALPAASVDLVVMHSVAQYLTADQCDGLFRLFRRLLRVSGRFVLGDVIRPDVSALTDAFALLRLGAANGFLLAALAGLVRTVLSDYWRLRRAAGLTRYDEAAMMAKLAAAGFSAQRAVENIGHNQARMTFVARPVS